jgi:hypothetical protein
LTALADAAELSARPLCSWSCVPPPCEAEPLALARAQARLSVEARQQLLAAIYDGQPFRRALRDLGLTSKQVGWLTKTDKEWSTALEAVLMATLQPSSSRVRSALPLLHGQHAEHPPGPASQAMITNS